MSNYEFEIHGTEELKAKIQDLLDKYPADLNDELSKCAVDFQKDVNKKFPNNGKTGGSYAVSKKWEKTKETVQGYTVQIELQNQAPHFHLVENGHNLKISPEAYAIASSGGSSKKKTKSKGKRKYSLVNAGFVPGRHYCEKTRNEWNDGTYTTKVDKRIKKLLKKVNLT